MKSKFIARVRFVFAAFALAAVFLCVRLYVVQVVHSEEYRDEAQSQYIASNSPTEQRGDIFFRDKNGRLAVAATQQGGWRIAINPQDVVKPEALFKQLSSVVEIDEKRFFASTADTEDPYEEIAFRLTDDDARAVRDLDLDAVTLVRERWRTYPGGALASQVLGFVGFSGHDRVGRYGLERYFEDTLAQGQHSLYINFFAEIFSNVRSFTSETTSDDQGDLITTIEPGVQQHLEELLEGVDDTYTPKTVGGIVIDPRTGAIIAMAARPTFDPNVFNLESDPAVFVNPMVERVYEMGSIVKPLTMAAGVDAGAVTAQTEYEDLGYVYKSGARISNYDGRGRGRVSMQEVLNQSLNTGVVFVVDKMGHKVFDKYLRAYALAEETGIDLPNEARGILGALDSGTEVDYAAASFGQGLAITPIAMVRALATLANGGMLISPHIVSEIRYGTGITKKLHDAPDTRVLKEESVAEVTRMLVKVVDEALANGTVKIDRYSVAAKTGTAQIASPNGGYYEDRYLHSFFGYFPAHDAQFLVFLFAVEPHGERYASGTLTTPFMDMTHFLINYYDIPPDR